MAKTKFEEMMDRLPSTIKNTDVLREESKKVLAALLELLLHSEAKQTKVIFVSNSMLRRLSGINNNMILPSVNQLIDYDLISRKSGKPRKEGEKSEASEYTINIKKLKEPLVEKTFDDLFSDFLENEEPLEKPINTAITTTITTTIPITTSTTNTTTNTNSIENTNTTKNTIENTTTNSTTSTNTTEKKVEVKRNKLKENIDYLEEEFESFKAEIDTRFERCINEDELREIRGKLSSKNEKENALNKPRLRNRISSYLSSKFEKCYESLQHQCAVATSSNNNYDDELPF